MTFYVWTSWSANYFIFLYWCCHSFSQNSTYVAFMTTFFFSEELCLKLSKVRNKILTLSGCLFGCWVSIKSSQRVFKMKRRSAWGRCLLCVILPCYCFSLFYIIVDVIAYQKKIKLYLKNLIMNVTSYCPLSVISIVIYNH